MIYSSQTNVTRSTQSQHTLLSLSRSHLILIIKRFFQIENIYISSSSKFIQYSRISRRFDSIRFSINLTLQLHIDPSTDSRILISFRIGDFEVHPILGDSPLCTKFIFVYLLVTEVSSIKVILDVILMVFFSFFSSFLIVQLHAHDRDRTGKAPGVRTYLL